MNPGNPNSREVIFIMMVLGFAWGITYGLIHAYVKYPCPDLQLLGFKSERCISSNEERK